MLNLKTYGKKNIIIRLFNKLKAKRGFIASGWAYGDDWVKDNCHLNNESKYDYCPIIIDGNSYKVALQNINISQMKSCRETVCAVNIYVKHGGKK